MDMLWAFGSIWVSQPDRVSRIDPATGRVQAIVPAPGTSDFRNLAAGVGSIWVDDSGRETLTRIDAARNRVIATIPMRSHVFVVDGLAFVDGKLWVVRPVPNDDAVGDVVSIDPTTNRITQRGTHPTHVRRDVERNSRGLVRPRYQPPSIRHDDPADDGCSPTGRCDACRE